MLEQENTEKKILNAARELFRQKGFAATRMQEIAKAADINKAMLHYYFRSKEKLFEQIFREAFDDFFPRLVELVGSDLSLAEKISGITAHYARLLTENPHLPGFVIHEIQQRPEHFIQILMQDTRMQPQIIFQKLAEQVQEEVAAGHIRPVDPRQLFVNLISWSVFPFLMRPVLTHLFGMSDSDFAQFIEARKQEVPAALMRSLKP